ncbi:hypothetical protein CA850_12355 [Micromonospora echinospora]|uniref:Uncharacterized protein n=1 Tax=Micromonospora echinospora TaxID=1877 RepID=A0A1C4UA18_MICEC|nr:hypothetical protein [Micromonospora echinospora]OZV80947.1 hypothetical protein CA850_12355 [Micromonospora echinospora]SCE68548.1 hypothetical protein GA0070618_0148 [Micromonospora echinospora]
MKVLFLGGPWHNERHEVTPARASAALRSLPLSFTVPLPTERNGEAAEGPPPPRVGGHVTYTRRYARAGGERLPVYVAPNYQGPPRA